MRKRYISPVDPLPRTREKKAGFSEIRGTKRKKERFDRFARKEEKKIAAGLGRPRTDRRFRKEEEKGGGGRRGSKKAASGFVGRPAP